MNSDDHWTVEYFVAKDGQPVVIQEIESFGPKGIAKILRTTGLLEKFGLEVGGDYVAHVVGKIWELRVDRYRVLYFTVKNKKFLMVRAFMKKTDKTPDEEIKIAQNRMAEFLQSELPDVAVHRSRKK